MSKYNYHGANEHITSVTTSPYLISIIVAQRFHSLKMIFMSSLQRCVVTPNVMCASNY